MGRGITGTHGTPGPVRGDCGGCAGAGVSGGLCARLACLRASLASRSAATSYSPGKRGLSAARMGAGSQERTSGRRRGWRAAGGGSSDPYSW